MQFEEMTTLHDRIAENGLSYAGGIHSVYEELTELANKMERGRKHWKQFGLSSEKTAHDADLSAEKVTKTYHPFLDYS
jgi:hypothetical protein